MPWSASATRQWNGYKICVNTAQFICPGERGLEFVSRKLGVQNTYDDNHHNIRNYSTDPIQYTSQLLHWHTPHGHLQLDMLSIPKQILIWIRTNNGKRFPNSRTFGTFLQNPRLKLHWEVKTAGGRPCAIRH
jgi:hypothetical protein